MGSDTASWIVPLASRAAPHRWTFITHHAQVLLVVARQQDVRVREIASATGITERYAYQILRDLEDVGYVERRRHGRCNVYRVNDDLAVGDRVVEEEPLRELLPLIEGTAADEVAAMSVRRSFAHTA